MKLPKIFKSSSSIANHLTWRVVGTITLIFTLISALIFIITWGVGFGLLMALYKTEMNASSEKINSIFSAVEIAVQNNKPEVVESLRENDNEFFAVKHLLKLNPNIVGAAVAYNPDFEPRKGEPFAPYAYRDGDTIKTRQLNTPEYDYLNKEWYKKPIEVKEGWWSEPYVDKGGGEIPMTTFSLPLVNKKGEICAVQTADIALDWITELVQHVDSIYNNEYYRGVDSGHSSCFIVTHQGSFVAHTNEDLVMNSNLKDYFTKILKVKKEGLIDNIVTRKKSILSFRDNTGKSYIIVLSPIKHTTWTICIVVPMEDITIPINAFIYTSVFLMLIGLIIVGLVCRRTIHRITKPLMKFTDSVDEIAKGNLKTELPEIKTKDEMLRLRNSFEMMQHSLIEHIEQTKTINEEKGRMESELRIASDIQGSMLLTTFPAFPDRNDIDIFAQLKPAKEVGGDLYDYYIRDEKLFFCVGDVSGKGIPASLIMVVTQALFRTAVAHQSNPGKIISGINDISCREGDSSMFTTLFVGVLDLPTGRLRYSNAAHNGPILINNSEITSLPCDPNIPVGLDSWKFTTQEVIISPQTTIFLYTDGLTEAENLSHEQFEEERIFEVARQTEGQPQILIEKMTKAVEQFVGNAEQSDDLTMLAIMYTKQSEQDARLQRSITLINDVEQVPELTAFVEEVCEELNFDMDTTMSLNLAIEEAVVNVMEYAYPADTKGEIKIEALANSVRLKFVISDWGKPFDPTSMEEVDTTLSVEERPIGGLGIHLVRQIMDSLNYERIDGKNVLTLRKKLV